jgi:two-component system, NarL family, nitrate/nitrite response regulator NarL
VNNPVRILLIDDHSLFRESLVRLLEAEPDFRVVAHCATVSEGIHLLSSTAVDVVLLDYDLGEEVGTDLLQEVRARRHTAKVLMVTAGMSDSVARNALKTGVAGVIFKHSGTGQLIEAILKVAKGEMWLDSGAIRSLIAGTEQRSEPNQTTHLLTDRQRKVLRGILNGLTNKEIASTLQVSETSIKAVIQELFNKAGVRTRSQLVRVALEKYSTDWLRSE